MAEPRQTARSIILKDASLLVIKRDRLGRRFYTLPGGGIDDNEDAQAAVIRELREETGIEAKVGRLVMKQDDSKFGQVSYFLCRYISGEPRLDKNSPEARDNELGTNTYEPKWVDLNQISEIGLLPDDIIGPILKYRSDGWPEGVVSL